MQSVNTLVECGYAPLVAMVLAARGIKSGAEAKAYLDCDAPLPDPYLIRGMTEAAGRIRFALSAGEKIAVFGDYDVDGVTATCLLTDYLRSRGADCVPYIPGRLDEGYGLNPLAIRHLHAQGVSLIITVDCGITAIDEALLCRQLGIDLVITDHHECKESLPEAVAVLDPHRADDGYPHKNLSGVGVAFKLAGALCGSQEQVLDAYCDMICLGTVADVMPLHGENRVFVCRGLTALKNTQRPGLAALMELSGCSKHTLCASSVGYMLAPRINAAGRMGKIDLAVELLLTADAERGQMLAQALCDLNRQRQEIESEIYTQAVDMLPQGQMPEAIVLADDTWHQGVVGIVASRIAEEYCCPAFLICLDGDHGKASSRSYGGFRLFSSLRVLSDLLESYGGHELAAGFTIRRDQIAPFRERISAMAQEYYAGSGLRTVLDADCVITPELLSVASVESLGALEPCGNGCPKPVLVMEHLVIENISLVGGGKHMRLRLRSAHGVFQAICFSATPESTSVAQGDTVDVAFIPQINEYRGERSVQINIQDIRPSCTAECSPASDHYRMLREDSLDSAAAECLLPDREALGTVWRYLAGAESDIIRETPMCLCRKIVRRSNRAMSLEKLLVCLDIFRDVGLLELAHQHKYISIRLIPRPGKADLAQSRTMQRLTAVKESVG